MSHFEIHDQKIPAGIEDEGYEFFYSEKAKDIRCTHNRQTLEWNEIPEKAFEIVSEDLAKHPEAVEALKDWNIHNPNQMLKQYIFCRFGRYDGNPDITADGQINDCEYFDCGIRGKCKYEGKLCSTIKVENGELTKRETEVLKEVAKGKLNKEIADLLNISEHTVSSHIQNIQQKGNFFRKFEMIAFAKDKNLI